MMVREEEIEAHLSAVRLDYRGLWLDSEHQLGQVAETLADATGWQPTDTQPMPDALALAQVAAARLEALERDIAVYQPRLRGHRSNVARRQREYA